MPGPGRQISAAAWRVVAGHQDVLARKDETAQQSSRSNDGGKRDGQIFLDSAWRRARNRRALLVLRLCDGTAIRLLPRRHNHKELSQASTAELTLPKPGAYRAGM